jgi:hypothetical protein
VGSLKLSTQIATLREPTDMPQIYYSDATGNDITPENNFYIIYGVSCRLHTLHTKFVHQSRSSQVDCWVNSPIWFDCTPGMADDRRGSKKYGESVTQFDNQTQSLLPLPRSCYGFCATIRIESYLFSSAAKIVFSSSFQAWNLLFSLGFTI